MSDGDSFYQKVRRETARLLGYEGTDNLPADQATRLDLATALRLGLDDMQARLLRGESVDVSKMLAATQELSRLLPTPAPAPRRDGTSARERLRAIVLAAIEADRANGEVPEVKVLRRQVAELQAELIRLRAVMSGQVKMLPAPASTPMPNRRWENSPAEKGKAKHVKRANDGGAEDSAATPGPSSPQPPVARSGAETRAAQQRLAADKSVEFQHVRPRGVSRGGRSSKAAQAR